MKIPPVSTSHSSYGSEAPKQQAQDILKKIMEDLKRLSHNPDDPKALEALAKNMEQLQGVVSWNPGSFSKGQASLTTELYQQVQAISQQMEAPTPGEIVSLTYTADQLHF